LNFVFSDQGFTVLACRKFGLVAAVEEEARRQSISTLWLYTNTAERIYVRVGWRTVETILHDGKPSALMRRDLLA
jgi:N-acetylglutamate synthase-like GNAT family acetyltransferase